MIRSLTLDWNTAKDLKGKIYRKIFNFLLKKYFGLDVECYIVMVKSVKNSPEGNHLYFWRVDGPERETSRLLNILGPHLMKTMNSGLERN